MSYVKVDEVEQYMKVDDTGIGMIPQGEEVKLPNPATGNNGDCIVVDNGRYVLGAGSGGSGGSGGGSGSSGLLKVNVIGDGFDLHLDKTWQEIHDADFLICVRDATFTEESESGRTITYYNITEVLHTTDPSDPAPYIIMVMSAGSTQEFICDSPNDYPERSGGGSGPESN